ncbi:hypothetical protein A2W54_02120 [Candidatus Giovannonibacteria bacterium RIFCSPHIGHO2_02_43_13]|uniref:Uncharacterized protein n=1 Tax=Candidatus Giovannonibacteria bacterium RIFCSPHIGHO2_02_43_13 TaxID=1798330 RepID=A0A1F5WUD0_9BACT|nr:MAG: hypothetical protein UW28_C0010G0011 [Parcubacteria group bacterium GW2011_GWA2_44_13]OGF73171.1 MAG: hypothetical protein A3E06_04325 [Candidatus Giovannonibacteria bacterium RIFCSPHIGHO2_12_FULL_44_42]OGF79255.1 MAG: hypothetical protein A2W54_02120 [Candidatus Giovannonibacteria bacterium RIFCSPHIGHO2_02_43_13]OGF88715.1 MAG: hypothetical protein A3I94_01385 [Candidatus Giovannonibacteria bacterium RIFCSPLOWO2_02_FULL_43_54]OGF96973.1 MAG: hypothetical protein A3H08_02030 [Candidatus
MKVSVKIKPGSKQEKIEKDLLGGYNVWVREPAKDGKANEAAIELLAKHFDVPKSLVNIVSGYSSKKKTFEIAI